MSNMQILGVLLVMIVFVGYVSFSFADTMILSPKKQLEAGVAPEDIQCREDKVLVIRDNGNTACVMEETAEKKGWNVIVEFSNSVDKSAQNNTENLEISKEIDSSTESPKILEQQPLVEKENVLILNPGNLSEVIPQDITFEYVLQMPPDDPDAFAQKMADFFDDAITETEQFDYHRKYVTERGWIKIQNEPVTTGHDATAFVYTFFGPGRINPTQAESVTNSLLKELGITLDGTEINKHGGPGSNYDYKFMQTKNDVVVASNVIITDFDPGYTFIKIGSWNDNLSEMNLYDIEQAKQNGKEHIFKYPELIGSNCNITYGDTEQEHVTLHVLEGKPIYEMYSGACDGNTPLYAQWYSTFVDAITGKPLYVQNRVTF